MTSEADARILIDKLLEAAGWLITNKAQVSTEEAVADGRADYLLKDSRTRPLAVLEAKRFAVDPYTAKEQAKAYALSLGAPFILLSNGQEHYYWDYPDGDARAIMGFPSQADLERRANVKLHRKGDIQHLNYSQRGTIVPPTKTEGAPLNLVGAGFIPARHDPHVLRSLSPFLPMWTYVGAP